MEPIMKAAEDIMYAKNLQDATKLLREYAHQIIDECAEVAELWKSVTPGWTKDYVKTVKKSL